jgi:hypothetical protein
MEAEYLRKLIKKILRRKLRKRCLKSKRLTQNIQTVQFWENSSAREYDYLQYLLIVDDCQTVDHKQTDSRRLTIPLGHDS